MPKVAPIKITYADGTTRIVKRLDGKLKPTKRRRRKGRQPREHVPRDVLAVAAALDREWEEAAQNGR
jgi:hypothetical protein